MDGLELALHEQSDGDVGDLLDALLDRNDMLQENGVIVKGKSARPSTVGSGLPFIIEIVITAATAEALRIAIDVLVEELRGKPRHLVIKHTKTKSGIRVSKKEISITTEEECKTILTDVDTD